MLLPIWDLPTVSNSSEGKISKLFPHPLVTKAVWLLPAAAVLSILLHSSHSGLDPNHFLPHSICTSSPLPGVLFS